MVGVMDMEEPITRAMKWIKEEAAKEAMEEKGSMDKDWTKEDSLEKKILGKKGVMEEKAVTIKWIRMNFQKVFRELTLEMVLIKSRKESEKRSQSVWPTG